MCEDTSTVKSDCPDRCSKCPVQDGCPLEFEERGSLECWVRVNEWILNESEGGYVY